MIPLILWFNLFAVCFLPFSFLSAWSEERFRLKWSVLSLTEENFLEYLLFHWSKPTLPAPSHHPCWAQTQGLPYSFQSQQLPLSFCFFPPKLLIIYNKHLICSSIKLGVHRIMSALMVQSKQNNGGLVPEKMREMSGPQHWEAENLIFNQRPVTLMKKKKENYLFEKPTTCQALCTRHMHIRGITDKEIPLVVELLNWRK